MTPDDISKGFNTTRHLLRILESLHTPTGQYCHRGEGWGPSGDQKEKKPHPNHSSKPPLSRRQKASAAEARPWPYPCMKVSGGALPPPAQSQGHHLGPLPEPPSSLHLFIAELLVLFICGFVFLFRSFVPRSCVLCPAGWHMAAEPGPLPLPRTPAPEVTTEIPPKHTHSDTHTQAHAHGHLLHTHARVHMLTRVMPVLVYARTHSHTRSASGQDPPAPPPPDSQPLAPHWPLLTDTPLSHTNLSPKCVR